MSSPFFSVIVPVYNVEKYLRECLDSILNQSFGDFELILVDDGSPDGSGAICDEYAGKDNRIKVIHKQNGGVSSARNAGLRAAIGEYILFCDSDDYYLNGAFESVHHELSKNPVDVLCFGIRKETQTGVLDLVSKPYSGAITNELLLSMAYAGIVHAHCAAVDISVFNKAYRRSIVKKMELSFDETMRIAEDILFNVLYFAGSETITCLNKAFYFYRFNMDSAIHVDKGFAEKGMERSVYFLSKIQRALETRIPVEVLYPIAKNRYNRIVIDACSNQNKHKRSYRERIAFIKQCLTWYSQYLAVYDVDLRGTDPAGKKAQFENLLIMHKRYRLIDLYTKAMNMYHRWRQA